jgi:hypothetical protein
MVDGGPQMIGFDPPLRPSVEDTPFTVELWLSWVGLACANRLADGR